MADDRTTTADLPNSPAEGGKGGVQESKKSEQEFPQNPLQSPLYDRQVRLENECLRAGVERYRQQLLELRRSKAEHDTVPTLRLAKQAVEPTRNALLDWIIEARKGPGRHAAVLPIVETLDPDVAALIGLRTVIGSCTGSPRSLQSTCIEIGRGIEEELRVSAWESADEVDFGRAQKYIERSPFSADPASRDRYRRNVMLSIARRKVVWSDWDTQTKLRVGSVVLDCIISATALCYIAQQQDDEVAHTSSRKRRPDTTLVVALADEARQWVEEVHAKTEMLHPLRLPMVHPPLPFTGRDDGGYLTRPLRRDVVRDGHKTMGRLVRSDQDSPIFFEALNNLQSVAYRVNLKVLDVAEKLWASGVGVPGYCSLEDAPLPPSLGEGATKDALAERAAEAKAICFANAKNRGRRLQSAGVISTAVRFKADQIYFPHFADFRGRLYPLSSGLNPQGSDLSKGLLEFSEGVSLGRNGQRWLLVQAANSFGKDKLPIADRVRWAEDNIALLERIGSDPLAHREWFDADAPFVALATCIDLAGLRKWRDAGHTADTYVSHLPVTVDGSCNGIQHLAALSRDRAAGIQVNLVPNEKPSDIYSAVAAVVKRETEKRAAEGDEFAQLWLTAGIDRSLTKRPTMIMPYGGTISAVTAYTMDWVHESKKTAIFGRHIGPASGRMASIIWTAIGEVVKGPREIMRWLQQVSDAVTKTGNPLCWSTPSGFRVRQAIMEPSGRVVDLKLTGKRVRLTVLEDTQKISRREQRSGVAPNFIHSLDAAALARTVVSLWRSGVRSMVAVHDSYGTHAGSMNLLASTLREEFVSMYRAGNLLEQFAADVSVLCPGVVLPPIPDLGDLNIDEVLDSEYFFA